MRVKLAFLATTLALVGMAQPLPEASLKTRAQQAMDTLLKRLLVRLNEEYQKGGTLGAVQACSEIAQALTREVGQEYGLGIRRVSLKNRSPHNAPDAWERGVLERWAKELEAGKPLGEVAEWQLEGQVYRVMRPILLGMPLCLECHGDPQAIRPEVRAVLQRKYPDDKATGFRLGDLRGAFSVIIVDGRK